MAARELREKQIRPHNIAQGPHNPVWIKTMVKVALQDGSGIADLYVYGADSYHLEELDYRSVEI
jgi:hypothetical protein